LILLHLPNIVFYSNLRNNDNLRSLYNIYSTTTITTITTIITHIPLGMSNHRRYYANASNHLHSTANVFRGNALTHHHHRNRNNAGERNYEASSHEVCADEDTSFQLVTNDTSKASAAAEAHKQAANSFRKGDYESAETFFSAAIANQPSHFLYFHR
jgi:hypothetical protein